MIDSKWRSKFQPIFNTIAKIFIRLKISPNTITWLAFGCGILASGFLVAGFNIYSIVFLWLSGLLDVMDGTVARLLGSGSNKGAYMDLILDRMVEAFFVLSFAYSYPQGYYSYLLFYIAVIFNFTTFIVAGALFKNTGNKAIHYDVGIAERTETFIAFTIMALLPNYISEILMVFNAIIIITGIIRFNRVLKYSS